MSVRCLLGGISRGEKEQVVDAQESDVCARAGDDGPDVLLLPALKRFNLFPGTSAAVSFLAAMLIVCGALVNGPYALITTAVSADLVRSTTQVPLHAQRLLPPSWRGICWDFCILALFSNASEAQRRRAGLSHLVLKHALP